MEDIDSGLITMSPYKTNDAEVQVILQENTDGLMNSYINYAES